MTFFIHFKKAHLHEVAIFLFTVAISEILIQKKDTERKVFLVRTPNGGTVLGLPYRWWRLCGVLLPSLKDTYRSVLRCPRRSFSRFSSLFSLIYFLCILHKANAKVRAKRETWNTKVKKRKCYNGRSCVKPNFAAVSFNQQTNSLIIIIIINTDILVSTSDLTFRSTKCLIPLGIEPSLMTTTPMALHNNNNNAAAETMDAFP